MGLPTVAIELRSARRLPPSRAGLVVAVPVVFSLCSPPPPSDAGSSWPPTSGAAPASPASPWARRASSSLPPVTLELRWDDADNDGFVDGTGAAEESLRIVKDGVALTDACAAEAGCDAGANRFAVEVAGFSDYVLFAPRAEFRRGDCDGDGQVTGVVTDAVFILGFNFLGGPRPACMAACDANGDGAVGGVVTDAVYLLTFNFLGGPPPVAPFPDCGPGALPGDPALGCGEPPGACD